MFQILRRNSSCLTVGLRRFLTVLFLSSLSGLVQAGEFTSLADMKFVDIPPGKFQMGTCKVTADMLKENKKRIFLGLAPLSTNCPERTTSVNDNETPQHTVNIAAFQLGKTPVTLGQYKYYVTASGATRGSAGWNLINDDFTKYNAFGDDAPVVQVSWQEAREFIDWLNKNKPANDHGTYRLPSEAEWEYACRAGGSHGYCGGDNPETVAWYAENVGDDNRHQQPVGRKAPNAWGLYDMSGNVWQWVEDAYHDNYTGAPVNGSAWTDGATRTIHSEAEPQQKPQELSGEARTLRVNVTTELTQEQRDYDRVARAQRGKAWKFDTTTARVLRGGSWKFGAEFAHASYRLAASPGNWYYGNGFRVARTLP